MEGRAVWDGRHHHPQRGGDEELVGDHLAKELDRLEPIAKQLGCAEELRYVDQMAKQAGYQRQKKVAELHDGDLRQVVLDSAARTRTSINGLSPL